jgi:hypothetical protein
MTNVITTRYETNIGNGVTSIEFDRKDIDMNKMAVTTLEVYMLVRTCAS